MKIIKFNKNGIDILVEVSEFSIYLTVESMGCIHEEALMPLDKDVLICTGFAVNGKAFGVQPPVHVMKEIRKAKEEEKALFRKDVYVASHDEIARRREEKEWDAMYNEGGDGYNPYRTENSKKELQYKGDEYKD